MISFRSSGGSFRSLVVSSGTGGRAGSSLSFSRMKSVRPGMINGSEVYCAAIL